jgi:hypothetical protein
MFVTLISDLDVIIFDEITLDCFEALPSKSENLICVLIHSTAGHITEDSENHLENENRESRWHMKTQKTQPNQSVPQRRQIIQYLVMQPDCVNGGL